MISFAVFIGAVKITDDKLRSFFYKLLRVIAGGGANGEKWRKMAKNGDGEFGFFICQIRHFSPIFDFGISDLTDF